MAKIGIVAGGGGLPAVLAARCQAAGRPVFVVRLRGFADHAMAAYPGAEIGVAELGKLFSALRAADCESVCLAGVVARPDFSALRPDWRGLKALPGAIAAARKGDDALLRFLIGEFEREGFRVEGAHEVVADLALPAGVLGRIRPSKADEADLARGLEVAREIGRLDIGQGAVVCDGLVLAVEAQEGTDAMLARCAALPPALRGVPGKPRGVLVKRPKPIQDDRVDMPTIGVATIQGAARAGLAGVAGAAGSVLLVDREAVIEAADSLGLFVFGAEGE